MFEIGTSLREARVRQSLDFPEAEQAIKIRGKYLRALEDEQFDILPAQTYVKGFLRSYAEYLGLDGQLYVDEYNSRFVVGEDEIPSGPRRSRPTPARSVRVQSRALLLTLLGIAMATALVIVAWTRGEPARQPIAGLGSTPIRTTVAPVVQQPRPKLARLKLTAVRGPCWLQIHLNSATGRILFQGTLEQSQSQEFVGKKLWITLDRPENLRVILNHRTRLLPLGGPKTLIVTPRGIRPDTV
jgi:cytoskeleton protein RodZ